MKSNLLRTFFEWALITSLLMSVGFFGWYYFKSRSTRIYQAQIQLASFRFQNNRTVMTLLEGECQEYATHNPDLARLLESMRNAAPASQAAPAATTPLRAK